MSSQREVWQTPLMTVDGDQYIGEAITLCGSRNIFAQLPRSRRRIDEVVLAADPASSSPLRSNWQVVLAAWRKWPQLPAVRNKQLLTIDTDELHAGDRARRAASLN